jgi:hypothetical protein
MSIYGDRSTPEGQAKYNLAAANNQMYHQQLLAAAAEAAWRAPKTEIKEQWVPVKRPALTPRSASAAPANTTHAGRLAARHKVSRSRSRSPSPATASALHHGKREALRHDSQYPHETPGQSSNFQNQDEKEDEEENYTNLTAAERAILQQQRTDAAANTAAHTPVSRANNCSQGTLIGSGSISEEQVESSTTPAANPSPHVNENEVPATSAAPASSTPPKRKRRRDPLRVALYSSMEEYSRDSDGRNSSCSHTIEIPGGTTIAHPDDGHEVVAVPLSTEIIYYEKQKYPVYPSSSDPYDCYDGCCYGCCECDCCHCGSLDSRKCK